MHLPRQWNYVIAEHVVSMDSAAKRSCHEQISLCEVLLALDAERTCCVQLCILAGSTGLLLQGLMVQSFAFLPDQQSLVAVSA